MSIRGVDLLPTIFHKLPGHDDSAVLSNSPASFPATGSTLSGLVAVFVISSTTSIGLLANSWPLGATPLGRFISVTSVVGPIIALFLSGAIHAHFLGMRKRVSAGFGLGFLLPGAMLAGLMNPHWTDGKEQAWPYLVALGILVALSFSTAGAIGAYFSRLGSRVMRASIIGFGIGGLLGAIAAIVTLIIKAGGAWGGAGDTLYLGGIFLAVMFPHVIGGTFLRNALGKQVEKANSNRADQPG